MASWYGTTGGASSPNWADNVRLYVYLAIAAGTPWTFGPHPYDRLDAGNTIQGGAATARWIYRWTDTPSPDGELYHEPGGLFIRVSRVDYDGVDRTQILRTAATITRPPNTVTIIDRTEFDNWFELTLDPADAGDVLGEPNQVTTYLLSNAAPIPGPDGALYVDVTCDVLSLDVNAPGTETDGAVARAEAATATIELRDPHRIYDPVNPESPYRLGGITRLTRGVPVWVFAEVYEEFEGGGAQLTRVSLFTGTVDNWSSPWKRKPAERVATVAASDDTKTLAHLDFGEQPPVGAGDTVDQRIERILAYYQWTGTRQLMTSTVPLQETTLAASAWELILRATDDEVGFVHLDRDGHLILLTRVVWANPAAGDLIQLGCPTGYDIVTAVGIDQSQAHNEIAASRTGGTMATFQSADSINRHGRYPYKRTDLGHYTDAAVAAWAQFMLRLWAYPRATVRQITLIPHFDPACWRKVLEANRGELRVELDWLPPDGTEAYFANGRLIGFRHTITRARWEVEWTISQGAVAQPTMHWGDHPYDQLDSGYVYT